MRYEANKYHQLVFMLICAIYLALAFAYAILVPPWEAPDEPAHYLYAQQLAERGRPPLQPAVRQRDSFCRDYPYISSNYEWYQPALGYLPAAMLYKTLTIIAPSSLPRRIPPLNPQFCANPQAHPNLFTHADFQPLSVWKNAWGLLLIRMYLALLGLAVIYGAYRIGCLFDPSGWLGIVAAGWLAFLPQFTFINASVRGDTLTNALAALVFLLAVSIQTPSPAPRNKLMLGIGILLGLGLLSKHTFISIIPIGLLAVWAANPHSPRAWLKPLLLMLLPVGVLVGAYYLTFAEARAALTYTFDTMLRVKPNLLTWDYATRIFQPLFIDLFFARFGWANVAPPATWNRVTFAWWIIGALVTFAQLGRRREQTQTPHFKIIVLLSIALFLAIAGVLRFNLSQFQPQGRLLFTALVPYGLIGFWGWWQILSRRGRAILAIAAPGFMLAFNLYALVFVLVPAYYK